MAEQMVLQQLLSEFRKQDEAWDQHTPWSAGFGNSIVHEGEGRFVGIVSWLKLGNIFLGWGDEKD